MIKKIFSLLYKITNFVIFLFPGLITMSAFAITLISNLVVYILKNKYKTDN